LFATTENSVKIENLLKGTDSKSVRILDLKMGTSTITKTSKEKPDKVEYRNAKDA